MDLEREVQSWTWDERCRGKGFVRASTSWSSEKTWAEHHFELDLGWGENLLQHASFLNEKLDWNRVGLPQCYHNKWWGSRET